MNAKIKQIPGVLVSVVLIAASFYVTVPAAASEPGNSQWVVQDIPGTLKNVILNGSAIKDIAVGSDGKTIYVANTAGDWLYRSTDAGQSFDSIKNNYATVGGAVPVAMSIAPDDMNTVAVTDGAGVFFTKNGGNTWSSLPSPLVVGASAPSVITDIAVAPARSGTLLDREYVISLADPAAGVTGGDVQIIGGTASWVTVGGGISGAFDFTSVVVSPGFAGDRCIVAIGTAVAAGSTAEFIINTATGTRVAGAPTGVKILSTGTTTDYLGAPAGASILSSSIALPGNFDPSTSSGRRAYVGIASNGTQIDNDVYRLSDTAVRSLGAVSGAPVYSVAYNGVVNSGTLFVGQKNNTDILYTTDMTSSSPSFTTTLKGPASAAATPDTIVAFASDYGATGRLFAGTIGAESAFNVSNDSGASFNQESLIDTGAAGIGSIRGVTFTTDAKTAFMNTKDTNNYISIWKSELPLTATSWTRIFSKPLVNVFSGCSLKLNPVPIPPLSLFFAETTTVNGPVYVSSDGGTSFVTRHGPAGAGLKTFSVRDGQTLYYLDAAASIYKSTNASWTWGSPVPTGVPGTATQSYTIILPKANQLIIGGSTVAVSGDDAASFTLMNNGLPNAVPNNPPLPPASGYWLNTDTRYAENSIIYAVDTGLSGAYNIYRIKTNDPANTWENMGVTVAAPAGGKIVSMTVRSGVLYAMTNQIGATGGSLRTLYPTETVSAQNQNWHALNTGLPVPMVSIGAAPGVILYAADAASMYAFNDFLASSKPALVGPEDNYSDAVDPNTGNGYPVDLAWKSLGTGNGIVDAVQIEFRDKSVGLIGAATATAVPGSFNTASPVVNTSSLAGIPPALQPNHSYLWRVRAAGTQSGQSVDGPWSETRTINVQAGAAVVQQYAGPVLLGPAGGAQDLDPAMVGFSWAPVAGATEYTVIVATDAALTKPVAGTPAKVTGTAFSATGLAQGTSYFWGVQVTKPTTSIQTIGTFTTIVKPVTAPAGGMPSSGVPATIITGPVPPGTPAYAWAVIALGVILTIIVIFLIFKKR